MNSDSDAAIVGLPEAPVLGVVLRNVRLSGHNGMTIPYAEVKGSGVIIKAQQGDPISQGAGAKVSLH